MGVEAPGMGILSGFQPLKWREVKVQQVAEEGWGQ